MSERQPPAVTVWPVWVRITLITVFAVIVVVGVVSIVSDGVDGAVVRVVIAAVVVPALVVPFQVIGVRRRSERLVERCRAALASAGSQAALAENGSDLAVTEAAAGVAMAQRHLAAGDLGASVRAIERAGQVLEAHHSGGPLHAAVVEAGRTVRAADALRRRAAR